MSSVGGVNKSADAGVNEGGQPLDAIRGPSRIIGPALSLANFKFLASHLLDSLITMLQHGTEASKLVARGQLKYLTTRNFTSWQPLAT